eukprot:GHVH01013523.1.p1 GENE.GHVH01013523.1~~GHVH01013523.1.p1  ORF type:complete len:558 (-),score=62.05 GHVH01013523.1:1958-3631(-)
MDNAIGKRVEIIGILKSRARQNRDCMQEFFVEVVSLLESSGDSDHARLIPPSLKVLEKNHQDAIPVPWARSEVSFNITQDCSQLVPIVDGPSVCDTKDSMSTLYHIWKRCGQAMFECLVLSLPSEDLIINAFSLLSMMGGHRTEDLSELTDSYDSIRILWIHEPSIKRQELMRRFSHFMPNGISVSCLNADRHRLLGSISRMRIFDETPEETVAAGPLVLTNQSTCWLDDFERLTKQTTNQILQAFIHRELMLTRKQFIKGGTAEDQFTDIVSLPVVGNVFISCGSAKGSLDHSQMIESQLPIDSQLLKVFDAILVSEEDDEGRFLRKDVLMAGKRSRQEVSIPAVERTAFQSIVQRLKYVQSFADSSGIKLLDSCEVRHLISYARQECSDPIFEDSAKDALADFYLKMKARPRISGQGLQTSMHTLISLKNLARARARCDLSNVVTHQHVADIMELFDEYSLLGQKQGNVSMVASNLTSKTGKRTGGTGLGALLPGFERALQKLPSDGGTLTRADVFKLADQIIAMKNSPIFTEDLIQAANDRGVLLKQSNGWRLG